MKEQYTLTVEILKGFSHSASICQVLLCLRGRLGGGREERQVKETGHGFQPLGAVISGWRRITECETL